MPILLPLKLDLQFFAENPPVEPDELDTPPANPEQKTYDETYVKQLREEAARYRKKAKEVEQGKQTQQQEMLNKVFAALGINPDPNLEFEKQLTIAQQQAQEAEKKANEKLMKAEVKAVGAELGIIDTDVAYLLVDKSTFTVKDDGSVEGVKEALEQVIQEKPYLAKTTPIEESKPSGYNPGSPQKGNDPKPKDKYETGVSVYQRLKGNKTKEE